MANKPNNPSLWSRAKSMAKQKFDVYPCVPMDSQALTKDGWKYYHELKVGDNILAYNQETDKNEWTPILALQFFNDAPLIRLYKKQTNFDIKCTPNHKWVLSKSNSKYPDNLVEAKDITKHMSIKTSAELSDNGDTLDLSKFFKKDSWVKNILNMSIPQIQSYFASGIVYDGNDKGLTKKEDKQTYGFSQKELDHGLAMEIAATLLGYRVCSVIKKHNPLMTNWTFIRRNTENTSNLYKEDAGISDVWCPTTKFGTWVMKQNGYITITGNSAYANGWAAKWYKSKGGTWRSAQEGGMYKPMYQNSGIITKPVVVTAKRPTMYEKRVRAAGKDSDRYRNLGRDVAQGALNVAELTGVPGTMRFIQDPLTNLQGTGKVIENFIMDSNSLPDRIMNTRYNRPEDLQGLYNTLDAATIIGGVGASFLNKPIKGLTKMDNVLGVTDEPNVINKMISASEKRAEDINKIKQLAQEYKGDFNTPEGIRRLANLGLTPEDLNEYDLLFKSDPRGSVFTKRDVFTTGSKPSITIDLDQINQFKNDNIDLLPETVFDHELGHYLQEAASKKQYDIDYAKYLEEVKDINARRNRGENVSYLHQPPQFNIGKTKADTDVINIDFDLKKMKQNRQGDKNSLYFTKDLEAYPHARELRRNMINTGILKNKWDDVTDDMLNNFITNNPNDRISSFIRNAPKSRKILKDVLNKYPALVPGAIGIGTGINMLDNKRMGGRINYQTSGSFKNRRNLNKDEVRIDGIIYNINHPNYRDVYEEKVAPGNIIWNDNEKSWMSVAPVDVTAPRWDKNLSTKQNEKIYQDSQKRKEPDYLADVVRRGTGDFARGVAKGTAAMAMTAGEVMSTPIALIAEYAMPGKKNIYTALPNIERVLTNLGVEDYNYKGGEQKTIGSLFTRNPYAQLAIDLPIDILTGKGLNAYGKLLKSAYPEIKSTFKNIGVKPKKTGTEWMKEWYSSPEFLSKYDKTGYYYPKFAQKLITDNLDAYKPKNYFDLWKDKGFKAYADNSLTTGGLSYGNPDEIYVNRSAYPFNKKNLESVRAHELTHLIEDNGYILSDADINALLKPFGYNDYNQVISDIPSNSKKSAKSYYLDPSEIHARMNQARYDLDLKHSDEFTEEMFDKIKKDQDWYGMGNYIIDKKGFIDLMNNFWAVGPAAIGTGAGINMLNNQRQGNRMGGRIQAQHGVQFAPIYKQEGGRISAQTGNTLYVSNPNDPRLKSYQDSSYLHKSEFELLDAIKNKNKNVDDFQGKNQGWGPFALKDDVYLNIEPIGEYVKKDCNGCPKRVFQYEKPKRRVEYLDPNSKVIDPISTLTGYMSSKGLNPSFNERKKWAADAGIQNYSGTAEQNILLKEYITKDLNKLEKYASPGADSYRVLNPTNLNKGFEKGTNKLGGRIKAQESFFIKPTQADSLSLYNSAIDYKDKLKQAGFKRKVLENDNYQDTRNLNILGALSDMVNYLQDTQKSNPNLKARTNKGQTVASNIEILSDTNNPYVKKYNPTVVEYKDEKLNQFIQPFESQSVDFRIQPQEVNFYEKKLPNGKVDIIPIMEYDPVAIKPFVNRSPEEHVEFQKKYGMYPPSVLEPTEELERKRRMDDYNDILPWLKKGFSPEDAKMLNEMRGMDFYFGGMHQPFTDEDRLKYYKQGMKGFQPNAIYIGKGDDKVFPSMEDRIKMNQDPDFRDEWTNKQRERLWGKDYKTKYPDRFRKGGNIPCYTCGGQIYRKR